MGNWFVQLAHIALFGLGFFLYNRLMSLSKKNDLSQDSWQLICYIIGWFSVIKGIQL